MKRDKNNRDHLQKRYEFLNILFFVILLIVLVILFNYLIT